MKLFLFLRMILLIFGVTEGLDKTKISQFPPSQRNFIVTKIFGLWYIQADIATCSWPGVDEFQDWSVDITEDKRGIAGIETWRSRTGDCTTMYTKMTPRSENGGCFILQDTIGNVLSGDQVFVATDYKTFIIEWGCVKRSVVEEECDDPYITVSTRLVHPKPYTFKIIEIILQKIWGISLKELRRVQHKNDWSNLKDLADDYEKMDAIQNYLPYVVENIVGKGGTGLTVSF